jgi:hypothetical protein
MNFLSPFLCFYGLLFTVYWFLLISKAVVGTNSDPSNAVHIWISNLLLVPPQVTPGASPIQGDYPLPGRASNLRPIKRLTIRSLAPA